MNLIFYTKNKIIRSTIEKIYINKFRIIRGNFYFIYLKKMNFKKFDNRNLYKNILIKNINIFLKFSKKYYKKSKYILKKINLIKYSKKKRNVNLFFLEYLKKKYVNISFFFINILLFIKSVIQLLKNKKEKLFKNKLIRYNYHKLNIRFFFFELFKNANQTEWSFLLCFFIFFKLIPYDYLRNFKGFIFRFFYIKSIFHIKNMFNFYFFKTIKKKIKSITLINHYLFRSKDINKKDRKFIYSNFFIKNFNKKIRINKRIKEDLKKIIILKNYYLQNKFNKKSKLYLYKKENNFFFNRRLKFYFFRKYKKNFINKERISKYKKNIKSKINLKFSKNNSNLKLNIKTRIVFNYIEKFLNNKKKKISNLNINKNINNLINIKGIKKITNKNLLFFVNKNKIFNNFRLLNFKKNFINIKKKFLNLLLLNYRKKRFINNFFFYNLIIIKNLRNKKDKLVNKYDYFFNYKKYLIDITYKNKLYLNRIFFNFFEKKISNNYKLTSINLKLFKKNLRNVNLKKNRINNITLNKLIKKKKDFEKINKVFQTQELFKELNNLKVKEKKLHYTLYVQIKRKNLFLTAFDHGLNKIIFKQSLGTCYIITDITDKKKIKKYKEQIMIKKMVNIYNNYIYKGLKKINIRIVALKNTSEVKFIVSKLLFGISKIRNKKVCLLNISYLNKKCHNGCRLKKKRRLKKRQSIY